MSSAPESTGPITNHYTPKAGGKTMDGFKERRMEHVDLADHDAPPVTRIPPEILTPILYACLPDVASNSATISANHPSIILSHVCSVWRAIMLDSPSMWTDMRIAVSSGPLQKGMDAVEREMKHMTKNVAMWKARSCDHPLSVWVTGHLDPSQFTTETTIDVRDLWGTLFAAITEATPRWKELTIKLIISPNCESLAFPLFDHPPARLPILEKASLEVQLTPSSGSRRFDSALSVSTLPSAPQLRLLKLHGPLQVKSLNRVWSPKLTVLDIDVSCIFRGSGQPHGVTSIISTIYLIGMLQNIPTLVDVTFWIGERSHGGGPSGNWTGRLATPPSPIVAQRLEKLTLAGHPVAPGFVPYLNLPSLKTLRLQSEQPHDLFTLTAGPVECITLLADRLQSLSFAHSTMEQAALIKIFDDLPNLTSLTLYRSNSERCVPVGEGHAPNIDSGFLKMLNEGWTENTGFMRVPLLRELYLEASDAEYEDDTEDLEGVLVEFIAARRVGGTGGAPKLEVVGVDLPWEEHSGRLGIQRELERRGVGLEGFELCVRYP